MAEQLPPTEDCATTATQADLDGFAGNAKAPPPSAEVASSTASDLSGALPDSDQQEWSQGVPGESSAPADATQVSTTMGADALDELEDLEFMLEEIEGQIAPLAL